MRPTFRPSRVLRVALLAAAAAALSGCGAVPRAGQQAALRREAAQAKAWFLLMTPGVRAQVEAAAGTVVFPEVAQWGTLIGGGAFGRGVVYDRAGRQIGWAAMFAQSLGVQFGLQGYRMMIVVEDERTLRRFMLGAWEDGLVTSASATLVAGDAGERQAAPFDRGVAIYTGFNRGAMAGINITIQSVGYASIAPTPPPPLNPVPTVTPPARPR